jgi:hypothetical protein
MGCLSGQTILSGSVGGQGTIFGVGGRHQHSPARSLSSESRLHENLAGAPATAILWNAVQLVLSLRVQFISITVSIRGRLWFGRLTILRAKSKDRVDPLFSCPEIINEFRERPVRPKPFDTVAVGSDALEG